MNKNFFALLLALGVTANGLADSSQPINYKQAFFGVSVLEMPAKAAELVSRAPAKDREVISATVVQQAATLKPTALPAVVGAIAKGSPEVAASAAAVGAAAQPKLAVAIAKAAAAAAPAKAVEIAQAVAKALPAQAREVALMVASVAPAEASAALAKLANETVSATTTAVPLPTGVTPPPRPPTIGAPYNPLPQTTPGQGSVTNSVPPGGRDYATP
jgi:hypothetical protein